MNAWYVSSIFVIAVTVAMAQDDSGPVWDLESLGRPPRTWPADGFSSPGVNALYFEGVPLQGRPTRVFAWLGMPPITPGARVPAMVLVHGGGGTAFADWVRLWTARGYAAIAMDTCGAVPRKEGDHWERNPDGGPCGWGGFDQIDRSIEDQWAYHAVAAAIRAHSLLRSLPAVDSERIGLTGISWGGYLACLVAGNDPRFRLAVPVYGCGFTTEHTFAGSVSALGSERGAKWMHWWDPSNHLAKAAMPFCWITGSNDFAYTLNAWRKSCRLPSGPRTLVVRLRMPHGHGGPGETPPEIFAFADSILNNGEPLLRITSQGRHGEVLWATFAGKRSVMKVELNWTCDAGPWPQRLWLSAPATIDGSGRMSANIPKGATACYFNLFDDRGCVVSSEHVEPATEF